MTLNMINLTVYIQFFVLYILTTLVMYNNTLLE